MGRLSAGRPIHWISSSRRRHHFASRCLLPHHDTDCFTSRLNASVSCLLRLEKFVSTDTPSLKLRKILYTAVTLSSAPWQRGISSPARHQAFYLSRSGTQGSARVVKVDAGVINRSPPLSVRKRTGTSQYAHLACQDGRIENRE